jgi:hypothetical protein
MKKKPTLDRVSMGPMIAPGREEEEGERHTNSYERKRGKGEEKQTEVTYLVEERL